MGGDLGRGIMGENGGMGSLWRGIHYKVEILQRFKFRMITFGM